MASSPTTRRRFHEPPEHLYDVPRLRDPILARPILVVLSRVTREERNSARGVSEKLDADDGAIEAERQESMRDGQHSCLKGYRRTVC